MFAAEELMVSVPEPAFVKPPLEMTPVRLMAESTVIVWAAPPRLRVPLRVRGALELALPRVTLPPSVRAFANV